MRSAEKEIQFYLDIITCDPSKNTMDYPKIIISNQNEESISEKIAIDIQKANFREQINKLFDSVLLRKVIIKP